MLVGFNCKIYKNLILKKLIIILFFAFGHTMRMLKTQIMQKVCDATAAYIAHQPYSKYKLFWKIFQI